MVFLTRRPPRILRQCHIYHIASFLNFIDSLKKQPWNGLQTFKVIGIYKKKFMYGMRIFSAEFLSTVHVDSYSQNEFHAQIFFLFFFFLNTFRAGMADNENTLACTTRQKLMSLADIISY